ncbi:tol-pal system YbgF family protein [Streptomyces sp. NPDC056716]|uniref:tetratricopeptide repeat protein n=1 Tax=unclassified Streptomyces TaxID=2593676 RepID=UPI0036C95386
MIALHEEHGEAVATWARQGYRDEKVVCFDRHLDLKPLPTGATARLLGLDGGPDALAEENRKLPIREAAGSYGLDDFYAAGAVLGQVAEMTWVRATDEPDSPTTRQRLLTALSVIVAEPDALEHTSFGGDGSLRSRTCGLELTVHTPRTFARSRPDPRSRVDIDLDWFADIHTGSDHQPAELLDLLREHGLDRNVDSMTFSVRSGFLPESCRGLAAELANKLGRTTDRRERDAVALPTATFAALRGQRGPDDLALHERELAPLGPIGTVLLGLLRLRAHGDLDGAAQAWQDADDAGCRSSWLAYGIALAHYGAGAHGAALRWFTRATGAQADTIEVRSRFMTALCLLRTGDIDAAHAALLDFSTEYPLHLRAATLAAETGARIGAPQPPWLVERTRAHHLLIHGSGRR